MRAGTRGERVWIQRRRPSADPGIDDGVDPGPDSFRDHTHRPPHHCGPEPDGYQSRSDQRGAQRRHQRTDDPERCDHRAPDQRPGKFRIGQEPPKGYKVSEPWECEGGKLQTGKVTEMEVWFDDAGRVDGFVGQDRGTTTRSGVTIFTPVKDLKKTYSALVKVKHPRVEAYALANDTHSLLFEIEDGHVAVISVQVNATPFYMITERVCGGP